MQPPDWKLFETVQKKIRIIRVEAKGRYIDVFDLDVGVPLCLSAGSKIDLGKIKRAKIYVATVNVFKAELTPELEQHAFESAMGDLNRLRALRAMKGSGEKPTKYELIGLKH
jgi:hypothetical protein